MLGVPRNGVILQPHDDKWIEEFNIVKARFLGLFTDNIVAVEHVGSTSIKGIQAKPMLDIALVIKAISTQVYKIMQENGYSYFGEVAAGKQLFILRDKNGNSLQHIHCYEEKDLSLFFEQLAFRDFLRNNPAYAKEYEMLKMRLAKIYPDNRKEYTAGKQTFFDKIKELTTQKP